ncbi:MAG TPA: UDP-N-acetylmuramoyl-tripeptide--D-alanyl-D-alanine ligase, partial [Candidatus Manganitrophaceae bacterium]|nr:UDP-N-acetylmuramoyl-tripeptide--D-alanyl-D-alanine ligase [Candidatus Manganitrophaceae bacterium]
SIDSRTIRPNEVFFALHGPRFDGHDFIDAIFQRGAAGAVVSRPAFQVRQKEWALFYRYHFFILVDDTLAALQAMAIWHRNRFRLPLVGVTGSNGKTTTKEMTASILSRRGPVLKNEGNLNNHIGLPLSLLRLREEHQAAVVEMGISQKGEMKRLCEIARPTVGLVTNIGPAHLEFLGDLAGVAKEKGELFESIGSGGTGVINRDDPYLRPWEERLADRWTFGIDSDADVTASAIEQKATETCFTLHLNRSGEAAEILLPIVGRHQVYNALAAAAVASALGLGLNEIREGLEQFRPVALRTEILKVRGATILLDAYNANPASMKAALQMLASYRPEGASSRRIALLGDMLELGGSADAAHLEIGNRAAQLGIDLLITVGERAEKTAEGARQAGMAAVFVHPDLESAQRFLRETMKEGDCLLIKGSRGMKMERVLAGLGAEGNS